MEINMDHFHHLRKIPLLLPRQSPTIHLPSPISVCCWRCVLPVLKLWSTTTYALLRKASFSKDVFEIHPCVNASFIPFYYQDTFCCMNTLQFVSLSPVVDFLVVSSVCYEQSCYEHFMYKSLYRYVSISLNM